MSPGEWSTVSITGLWRHLKSLLKGSQVSVNNFVNFSGSFSHLSALCSVDCSVQVWHVLGCSGSECQQFYLRGGQPAAAESRGKIPKCPLLIHSAVPPTAPLKGKLTTSRYQNQLSEQHRVKLSSSKAPINSVTVNARIIDRLHNLAE